VATFKDLIKLEYPKAFADELRAMLDFVRMLTAYEEAAATEAKAKQQQVRSASAPYPLPTTVYRLPSTYCLLTSNVYLLPAAYCLPPTTVYLLPSNVYLLPAACCLPPTAYRRWSSSFAPSTPTPRVASTRFETSSPPPMLPLATTTTTTTCDLRTATY
jgi:hypothetical protein